MGHRRIRGIVHRGTLAYGAVVAVAVVPTVAAAQGAAVPPVLNGQVEVGVTHTDYDDSVSTATGGHVRGAYRLGELAAIEVGYADLGEGDIEGTSAHYRVTGITAGARAYLPLHAALRLVGHLGWFWYDAEAQVLASRFTGAGDGPYVGLGAEWSLAPQIYLGAAWRRYEVHDIKPDAFTVTLGARF